MDKHFNRRDFLKSAGTAAATFTILDSRLVRGSQANSKIKLGVIGTGGRGTWIARLFRDHGGYEIHAAADYFQERVDNFGSELIVEPARRFTGLNGYKRLLETDVDAVAIISPPYFHPAQAAESVKAGKHVYLAKPIAVDVPGCMSVQQSGNEARTNGLVYLVDFQTRTHEYFQEAVKRVQYGEIGHVVCGEAVYHCGPTWDRMYHYFDNGNISKENKLRAWGLFRTLSGDVITEQNIHALDVAVWFLDDNPVRATGSAGQNRAYGDCHDYFSVTFEFPNDVLITFHSKQLGQGYDDITCRVYGESGTAHTDYFGEVWIKGERPYKGGRVENLYESGAVWNIKEFHNNVINGRYENSTVEPSVRSNLTTILGRMAAYQKTWVTWDEMMAANEKWTADLMGLEE